MRKIYLSLFLYLITTINQMLALQLSYRPLADHFHSIDQLSESIPDFFLIRDYKTAWQKQFGITKKDQEYLNRYQAIRKKYQLSGFFDQSQPNQCNGLFAPHPADVPDPIADAFYCSDTVQQALDQLSNTISHDEREIIRSVFDYFNEKLTIFNEHNQERLYSILNYFNRELINTKATTYLKRTELFYHAQPQAFKSILLLSRPQGGGFNGTCYGDHLQIILPIETCPINNSELMSFFVSVIVHEATHHISAYAPLQQKQELTKLFLLHTKYVYFLHFLYAVEEPLVMAHQMYFMKHAYPDLYKKDSPWFDQPLAKRYFIILETYYEHQKAIDAEFIINCAAICKEPIIYSQLFMQKIGFSLSNLWQKSIIARQKILESKNFLL
jgi:hypothetical protein